MKTSVDRHHLQEAALTLLHQVRYVAVILAEEAEIVP